MRFAAALASILVVCPSIASAETKAPPAELNLTSYGLLYSVPGMDRVTVRRDLAFKSAEGVTLAMDLHYPADFKSGASRPAVVFVNGVGDMPDSKLKEWGQYTSWGSLMAASGYIAVTHESRGPDPLPDVRDLFAHIFEKGAAYGIDTERIGLWACSANVRAALAYMMGDPPPRVAAAVLYYGNGEVASIRTDLPVQIVRAGHDNPMMNAQIDRVVAQALSIGAPWTVEYAPWAHHGFDIFDAVAETPRIIERTIAFYDEHLKPARGTMAAMSPERQAIAYGFFQEWPKALEAWERLLPKYPDNQLVLMQLGLAQANTGRMQDAVPNLERAVKMGEEAPPVMHALGTAYFRAQRYDDALPLLQKAIDGHFSNAQTFAMVGAAYMGKKSYPEAIGAFQRAIEMGPPTWPVYYNLACAYALSGLNEEAFAALGKAIDAGYKDPQGLQADPDLASLRGDPRYQELLKRLG